MGRHLLSVPKSDWLVTCSHFFHFWVLYKFKACSLHLSKTIGDSLEALDFNQLFPQLNRLFFEILELEIAMCFYYQGDSFYKAKLGWVGHGVHLLM